MSGDPQWPADDPARAASLRRAALIALAFGIAGVLLDLIFTILQILLFRHPGYGGAIMAIIFSIVEVALFGLALGFSIRPFAGRRGFAALAAAVLAVSVVGGLSAMMTLLQYSIAWLGRL